MIKKTLAALTLGSSLSVTGLHYVSHGWISIESNLNNYWKNTKRGAIMDLAASENLTITPDQKHWKDIATDSASKINLNPSLALAVIQVESNNGKAQLSPAGALGFGQVMPENLKFCELTTPTELLIPEKGIPCAIKILKQNIDDYGLITGLKVYNAGPKRVDKTEENKKYPGKVLLAWSKIKE